MDRDKTFLRLANLPLEHDIISVALTLPLRIGALSFLISGRPLDSTGESAIITRPRAPGDEDGGDNLLAVFAPQGAILRWRVSRQSRGALRAIFTVQDAGKNST